MSNGNWNVGYDPGPGPVSEFLAERYLAARRVWPLRNERAHDGFEATALRAAVPAQTWAEWFEWAYGMSLADYAAIAKEGDHAAMLKRLGSPVFDYKLGDRWLTLIGEEGDTVESVREFLRKLWPEISEVRAHE